jgi:hypothetical protein
MTFVFYVVRQILVRWSRFQKKGDEEGFEFYVQQGLTLR